MKTARWFSILYLSFFLWLLLFPPWIWMEPHYGPHPYTASYSLGNHWRFSVPLHWEWSEAAQRSFLVSDRRVETQIDYQFLQYEAVIGLVSLALLFLLRIALETPIRRVTACAKVEIILMRMRLQDWLRLVFRLPAKAAVPLVAAYLLAATFLAVRVPGPPLVQGGPPCLVQEPIQSASVQPSANSLMPWEEAAQEKGQRQPAAPLPLSGLRMKLLQEAVLFVLTATVYVGLAGLVRWRRRTQEVGAK